MKRAPLLLLACTVATPALADSCPGDPWQNTAPTPPQSTFLDWMFTPEYPNVLRPEKRAVLRIAGNPFAGTSTLQSISAPGTPFFISEETNTPAPKETTMHIRFTSTPFAPPPHTQSFSPAPGCAIYRQTSGHVITESWVGISTAQLPEPMLRCYATAAYMALGFSNATAIYNTPGLITSTAGQWSITIPHRPESYLNNPQFPDQTVPQGAGLCQARQHLFHLARLQQCQSTPEANQPIPSVGTPCPQAAAAPQKRLFTSPPTGTAH